MAQKFDEVDLVLDGDSSQDVRIPVPAIQVKECPSAASLKNPLQTGWLEKRGLLLGCIPTWKRRYVILKGGYIFKYEHEESHKTKGTPIPIYDAEFASVNDPDRAFCFRVGTMIKEYIFSAESDAAREEWLNNLRIQRSVAIKQLLGHLPISEDDRYANAAGDFLTKRKQQMSQVEADSLLKNDSLGGTMIYQ